MSQATVLASPSTAEPSAAIAKAPRRYNENDYFHRPDFVRLGAFLPLIDKHCRWFSDEKRSSKSHVAATRSALRHFLGYLQDVRGLDIGPANVDRKLALAYQAWNEASGQSNRWVYGLQGALRYFYKWLHAERILPNNAIKDLPLPTLIKHLPRPMEQRDIIKLLSLLDVDDFLERRDLTIFEVMYGSGLRVGDTLRLKIKDVVFEDEYLGPHLRVWTKWNTHALVPLSMATIGILKLHFKMRGHKSPEERLFIGKGRKGISVQSIAERWLGYLLRANLNPKLTMHQLRHATATHLYENGLPLEMVQAILVHRSLQTTTIYTQVSPQRQFMVYAKANHRGKVRTIR